MKVYQIVLWMRELCSLCVINKSNFAFDNGLPWCLNEYHFNWNYAINSCEIYLWITFAFWDNRMTTNLTK